MINWVPFWVFAWDCGYVIPILCWCCDARWSIYRIENYCWPCLHLKGFFSNWNSGIFLLDFFGSGGLMCSTACGGRRRLRDVVLIMFLLVFLRCSDGFLFLWRGVVRRGPVSTFWTSLLPVWGRGGASFWLRACWRTLRFVCCGSGRRWIWSCFSRCFVFFWKFARFQVGAVCVGASFAWFPAILAAVLRCTPRLVPRRRGWNRAARGAAGGRDFCGSGEFCGRAVRVS